MDVFKLFDAYSLRARLFPAVIAAAPALAALALLISWKTLDLSNAIATLAVLVLLFAISDFARRQGRKVERRLYSEYGGVPSIMLFRRNDTTIDGGSKDRYRTFLAAKLGVVGPTAEAEAADSAAADSFYVQCGVWLRQNTRDTKKFFILFNENVTYGFRRNLFGVKWLSIGLNLIVVGVCLGLLSRISWTLNGVDGRRILVVLLVAAAHAVYMVLAVHKSAVWDAARGYGRELILSCEAFLGASGPAASSGAPEKKSRSRKKPATTQQPEHHN